MENKTKISFPVLPQLNFSQIQLFYQYICLQDIIHKYEKFSGRTNNTVLNAWSEKKTDLFYPGVED